MSRQANGCPPPVPAGATVRTPTDMGPEKTLIFIEESARTEDEPVIPPR
jgi:hypothetical protein